MAFEEVVVHVVLQQLFGGWQIGLDRREAAVEVGSGVTKDRRDTVRERVEISVLMHAGIEQQDQIAG